MRNPFRNYIKEWLRLYPIGVIYDILSEIGNFKQWRMNLYLIMKPHKFNHTTKTYKLDHPMTTVLLGAMSIDRICRKLKPKLIEYGKSGYSDAKFATWLETEDHKEQHKYWRWIH